MREVNSPAWTKARYNLGYVRHGNMGVLGVGVTRRLSPGQDQ